MTSQNGLIHALRVIARFMIMDSALFHAPIFVLKLVQIYTFKWLGLEVTQKGLIPTTF
jgi:hypothetical protein